MHQKSPLIFPVPAWMSSSAGQMMQKKNEKTQCREAMMNIPNDEYPLWISLKTQFLAYKQLPNDEYQINIQVHQMLIFRQQWDSETC